MKIKNEKAIFDLYVGKDTDLRYYLKEPFIQENDGRVWASEGHIMIMINQECISGKYSSQTIGSHLPVREYNCDYSLSVSDLQNAIDRCPQEDEVIVTYKETTCPECKGFGEVDGEYRAKYDDEYYTISGECPICEGEGKIRKEVSTPTGKKIPKQDSLIKLGKDYLLATNIQTIIKTCDLLGIEQIRLVRTDEHDISIIELSKDIHIVLMPVRTSCIGKREVIEVKGVKV